MGRKPKKGASRKWAKRLKDLREQPPPKELVDSVNKEEKHHNQIMLEKIRRYNESEKDSK